MNDLVNTLSKKWDIPVLKMETRTRRRLFEQALKRAQNTGFVLQVTSGLILAWKDTFETNWLGSLAFRAWTCCNAPLTLSDLARFSAKLTEFGAGFAALSSWMPFPESKGFLNTGASVHAAIDEIRAKGILDDEKARVVVRPFGRVPEDWIVEIINHVGKTTWHDRHAKDYRLNPEKVKQRRTNWIEAQLRRGDGFLVAVLDTNRRLGAYVVVPLDRSRQRFGGPVVAGLNAVAGSIYEGRGFARRAITGAYRLTKSIWDTAIIQYQPENIPMAYIVNRSFFVRSCIRYDIHWHSDSPIPR
ncbi:hypothetical protein M1N20_04235 [Dehalococcoidia bacterium]|nr:hypothetical protein [Dehalococcoidia bacterium]